MKRILIGILLLGGTASSQDGWEISGTVSTSAGPLGEAYVTASPGGGTTQTDRQGHYSIKGSTPGLYYVSVQKKDNTSAPAPRHVTVVRGSKLQVDFAIPKGGVISGRVLDTNKQPVSGMIVEALSEWMQDGKLHLSSENGDRTNDLGKFRIPYLPDGSYVLHAYRLLKIQKLGGAPTEKSRDALAPAFYPSGRDLEGALVVEIRSGDEKSGFDITLEKQPTHCVRFKVGNEFGAHVGGSVAMRTAQGVPPLSNGSFAAGAEYEACGLASGEYRVHVMGTTKENYGRLSGYQMAIARVGRENVDLGLLEHRHRSDTNGVVSIKDAATDSPVPDGMRIRAVADEFAFPFATLAEVARPDKIQRDGSFVMKDWYDGEYRIRVNGLPAGYYFISATQQGRDVSDGGMQPGSGDVHILLGADGAAISGSVKGGDGAAIPDVAVLLIPKDSREPRVIYTDQNGAYWFSVGVPPGEYTIVASSRERPNIDSAVKLGTELKLGARESRTVDLKFQVVD